MSCILYSRSSYNALAKNPLFRHICSRDLKQSPELFAKTWFELNIKAFNSRYNETIDPVASALAGVDHEFITLLTGKYTDLYRLMGRIEYQLSDGHFDEGEDGNAYDAFLSFKDHVAYKAIEKLAPLDTVQIPNNAISLMDMIETERSKR